MQPTHEDPRVTRTRQKVLEVVREIMDERGPLAVSYSSVAKAAGVGRQTLYNHWATPDEMIRDAAVEGYDGGYPTEVTSGEDAIRQWLHSLRGATAEPRRRSTLSGLVAVAAGGGDSEVALRTMVQDRVRAFNEVLAQLDLVCSPETYARIVGPLQFQVLIARVPVTDELIDDIAESMAPELTPR